VAVKILIFCAFSGFVIRLLYLTEYQMIMGKVTRLCNLVFSTVPVQNMLKFVCNWKPTPHSFSNDELGKKKIVSCIDVNMVGCEIDIFLLMF
jgi:hypothetical protein